MIRQAGDAHLPESQRRINRQLVAAALARDAVQIQQMRQAGASLEAPGPSGFSPLSEYAGFGTAEQCEALLDAGANPNGEGVAGVAHGGNPAFTAVRFFQRNREAAHILRMLAARGADFNATASRANPPLTGETVLHTAARIGAVACGQALLDGGASPQARNAAGEQSAEAARAHGHGEFAGLLEARMDEAHMDHDPSMDWDADLNCDAEIQPDGSLSLGM